VVIGLPAVALAKEDKVENVFYTKRFVHWRCGPLKNYKNSLVVREERRKGRNSELSPYKIACHAKT
jgi:hypothetical protein